METSTVKFDSIRDLADHVQHLQDTNHRVPHRGNASRENYDMAFYGGWTIEKALDTALAGGNWQAGADAMPRVHVPHERLNGDVLPEPFMNSDVYGFAPNVPSYIAGTPDSMFDLIEHDTGDKLIRVAVHVGRYQNATQNHILNRGAAIMAVLDQLSKEGYSIELDAVWRNQDAEASISIETCIKHGTDHWTPASVAFALCHVSFQRRLCWRVAESVKEMGGSITNRGYGFGNKATFDDYDLSFGYVNGENVNHFESLESATDHIKQSTIEQLKKASK